MEQKLDLGKLERKTAAIIFKTGIVDIGIGMVFLVSALAMIFDDIRYYIDIFFIVPVVFILLAKRYIVDPRLGVVEFSKRRVKRSMWMIISITTFLVIMLSLTFLGKGVIANSIIHPRWIISGIIFGICISIAFFLEFRRMYLYGFIITGSFLLSEVLRDNPGFVPDNGYAYLFGALILLAIGSYYFITFLRKYPLINEQF
jgi:hypothetical protein